MLDRIDTTSLEGPGVRTNPPERRARLGQEDFFKLLITQLRNQDPFKPLASGEFLGQIAQFSTVAGIQDLQQSFEQLSGSLSSHQALQASVLVGRTVYVPGPAAALEAGGAVDGLIELPAPATALTVGIYDSAGQLVRRLTLGPKSAGSVAFHWDGRTDAGTAAAPGTYRLRAEAMMEGKTVSVETLVAARVESVLLGRAGEGITLNLAGLGPTSFAQVRRIQ